MHSIGIVQWDSIRRDHPGYPGRVSGSGLVTTAVAKLLQYSGSRVELKDEFSSCEVSHS